MKIPLLRGKTLLNSATMDVWECISHILFFPSFSSFLSPTPAECRGLYAARTMHPTIRGGGSHPPCGTRLPAPLYDVAQGRHLQNEAGGTGGGLLNRFAPKGVGIVPSILRHAYHARLGENWARIRVALRGG